MKITVNNFRGADHVEIASERMSLVAGLNGAGKTSVLLAAACTLSGDLSPLGLRKADGGALVKTGASGAECVIETESGTARAEWPKCERSTTDKPPFASEVAVGLSSIIEMDGKDRPVYLSELLKTDPSRADFDAALIEAGIATKEDLPKFDKVWDTVERDGWSAAHARAIDSGKTQKGNWNQVTKENWGLKKGETFEPEGWDSSLAAKSQETLDDAVTAARATTEHHVGRLAVSEDVIERLQASADKMDERKEAYEEAVKRQEAAKAELAEIEKKIAAIGSMQDDEGLPCPHCGEGIRLVKKSAAETTLAKAERIERKILEARRAEFASLDGARQRLRSEVSAASVEVDRSKSDFDASKVARDELDSGVNSEGSAQDDVDAAREAERAATRSRDAFRNKVEADRIHRSILRNLKMIDILAPSGVRHTVLKRKLTAFNDEIAKICTAARFGKVSVNDTLGIEYAGRAYVLLSASEQFRCRVALQIACADVDGSEAVIIDGADILDNQSRGGLFGMLAKRGGRAVIGMTMRSQDSAPDLASKGLGSVYWIECGKNAATTAEAA